MIKSNFYKPDRIAATIPGKYYGIEGPDGPPWGQRWGRVELDGTNVTKFIASEFRLHPSSQEDIPKNSIIHGFKLRIDSNVSPNTDIVSCRSALQNSTLSGERVIPTLIQGSISDYNIYDDFRRSTYYQSLDGDTPTIGSATWSCTGDAYTTTNSPAFLGLNDKVVYDSTPYYEIWSSQISGKNVYTTQEYSGNGYYTTPVAVIDAGTNTGVMGCWVKSESPSFDFLFRYSDSSNYMIARIVNVPRKIQILKVESNVETLLSELSLNSYINVSPLSNFQACAISVICEDPLQDSAGTENIQFNFRLGGRQDFVSLKIEESFNSSATKCGFKAGEYTRVLEFFHKTRSFTGTYPNLIETGGRVFNQNTCGGPTDKWGTSWSEIDWPNFLLHTEFQASSGSTKRDVYLNNLTLEIFYEEISNNGVRLSGQAIIPSVLLINGEGGAVASGSAVVTYKSFFDVVTQGGVRTSGQASVNKNIIAEGGVVTSGGSNTVSNITTTGTVLISGSAIVDLVANTTASTEGGIIPSGNAIVEVVYDINSSGGILTSGDAFDQWYIPCHGGITVAGIVDVQDQIVSTGGVVSGAEASTTFFDYIDGTGGVTGGGTAKRDDLVIIRYEAQAESNPIFLGGSAIGGVTGATFDTIGGVALSGESDAGFTFNLDIGFSWSTNAVIFKDVTFLWNLGQLPIFWYRIIGKGRDGDTCNLVADPCCQKFIVNIHARTLSELCEKLSSRNLNLAIDSVQRFSRPAERGVAGFDDECNVLEQVELCDIPKCAEFCVDVDVREVNWGFKMTVQVDSFFDYEITDGVYVSGSAICVLNTFLPDIPYSSSGEISIGGNAEYYSSGYTYESTGGITLSGISDFSASDWTFNAGEWPSIIERQFSIEQESLPEESTDKKWSLVEQISIDDNLYASTDLSFIKTSQYLIARNFQLNIPVDSDIIGLKVSIERFSTQSGVRDVGVYLVVGDEIISNNLADTTNDWPVGVSFSPKEYGQSGFDGTGDPWTDEPLDVVDLNDPSFGIALRVESQDSLPAIIANVDYIFVQVFYESNINQRLRLGGEALVSSSGMSYVGNGQLSVGGEASVLLPTMNYNEISTGGIVTGGAVLQIIDQEVSGGVTFGGEAIVDPIWGEGGSSFGGEALVTPYFEVSEGGIKLSGSSLDYFGKRYEASGGVSISGNAVFGENKFSYESVGGLTISGEAIRSTSAWFFESDGNAIFILGGADQSASDFGTAIEQAGFSMYITDMIMAFSNDEHLGDAVGVVDDVSQCGCLSVPLTISFEHNFASKNNILTQFLVRNNYSLQRRQRLSYNVPNNSWQSNVHFKGLSADANTEEIWDIVFELQCTSLIGSVEIGRSIWKLSAQFFRKNLTTGEDFDTRVVLGILPDLICNTNELNFTVTYDTQADVADVNPSATIYQSSIFDNIGLFKKRSWVDNPNLIITISQVGLPILQARTNVVDDVLNPDDRLVGLFQNSISFGQQVQLQSQ